MNRVKQKPIMKWQRRFESENCSYFYVSQNIMISFHLNHINPIPSLLVSMWIMKLLPAVMAWIWSVSQNAHVLKGLVPSWSLRIERSLDSEGSEIINELISDGVIIQWYYWKVVERRRWGLVIGSRSLWCALRRCTLFPGSFPSLILLPNCHEVSSLSVTCFLDVVPHHRPIAVETDKHWWNKSFLH